MSPVDIEEVPFTERPALLEGAVGLVSTVPDFLRFSQMLLNKGELHGARILAAKTVDVMVANGLSEAVLKARGGPMGWGLANVNVLMNPAGAQLSGQPRRVRLGRLGRDDLLGRPEHRDGRDSHDADQPANPDSLRAAVQDAVQQSHRSG